MSNIFKAVLLSVAALFSGSAAAKTFVADKARTISIVGPIGQNALPIASQIFDLSAKSTDQIDIIINSPGGSIFAGDQIISAMEIAQARGVRFRCLVPMMAASMAYQIYAHCDSRYAFKRSMLLWHPAAIFIMFGRLTSDDALYIGKDLRRIERPMAEYLIKQMGVSRNFFFYHWRHETLWRASDLKKEIPRYFEFVDDVKNVANPFAIGGSQQ